MSFPAEHIQVKQRCDVCGQAGPFVPGQIRVLGLPSDREQPVGQCPIDLRFFCAMHADSHLAELSAEESEKHNALIARTGHVPYMLYCPFDIGTALGQSGEPGALYTSEDEDLLPKRAARSEIIEAILRGAATAQGEVCSICSQPVLRYGMQISFITFDSLAFKGAIGGYCPRDKIFVCGEHAMMIEIDEHTFTSGCPQCHQKLLS